jgi:hypothetical protein
VLNADDFGLVPINPGFLRMRCPSSGDTQELSARMIGHMLEIDLIRTYQVRNSSLAFIPRNGFRPRAARPKYELPPAAAGSGFNELRDLAQKRQSFDRHSLTNDRQLRADDCHPPPTSTSTSTLNTIPLSPVDNSQVVDNSVDKSKSPKPLDRSQDLKRNPKTVTPPEWWKTNQGIAQVGQSLGMRAFAGESFDAFKSRIFERLREQKST